MEFRWKFLLLTTLVILCSQFNGHDCGVTKEQMEKTGLLFRQVCQPKHKMTDDVLEAGKNGIFPETKDFKCYVNCLFDIMQVTRRGKINYEKSLKQIDKLLPEDFKPAFRKGLDMCKDAAQGIKDNCDSAYVLLNCFYNNNPKFIFP